MKFATRMERMQASEIRELLKLTAQPDIISFAGGLPAPELFPVEEIAKVSHDLVLKEGRQLLQYATTEGRPSLRAKIAKRMADKYHTNVDPDDILITTGSQQCLDFAGKLFLVHNDTQAEASKKKEADDHAAESHDDLRDPPGGSENGPAGEGTGEQSGD